LTLWHQFKGFHPKIVRTVPSDYDTFTGSSLHPEITSLSSIISTQSQRGITDLVI